MLEAEDYDRMTPQELEAATREHGHYTDDGVWIPDQPDNGDNNPPVDDQPDDSGGNPPDEGPDSGNDDPPDDNPPVDSQPDDGGDS